MPKRSSLFACAVLVLISGCGTISNFSDDRRVPGGPPKSKPFGGVREDIACLTESAEPGAIVMLVDLPLSLVGDVFTLPWTLRAARMRKCWPAESPAAAP